MLTIDDLPCFLVKHNYNRNEGTYSEEKYFEDDKENEKFIELSKKIGTKVIDYLVNDYVLIEDGYEKLIEFLRERFLFSIKYDFACDSRAREILEEFLEINDRHGLVIKDDNMVIEALEQHDIFIFKQSEERFSKNTAFVFYLGELDKRKAKSYNIEYKIKLFYLIKEKIKEKIELMNKSYGGRSNYYGFEGFNESFDLTINTQQEAICWESIILGNTLIVFMRG